MTFLRRLYEALLEMLRPAPFEDDDPQSTDEATAARTRWVQDHRPDDWR